MKKVFKNIIVITLSAVLVIAAVTGCKKVEVPQKPSTNTNTAGSGSVDLTGKTPEIKLSDITATVGADIDYTSKLEIKNEEEFEDLEIWVNASAVDIYTPGEYKVTYTFFWGNNETSKDITVIIVEEEISLQESSLQESENSALNSEIQSSKENNNNETTKKQENKTTKPVTIENTTTNTQTTTKNQTTTKEPATTKKQETTKTTTKENTTSKNQSTTVKPTTKPTTKPQTTTKKEETTTTRKFIPSTEDTTTTVTNLGYVYIELLSGATVKVKTTSARYIVSTRTDISTITKNGVQYEVSKLIITFNTGTEQVLETVEKRI